MPGSHFDHPEAAALLRAVLAAPDDDAPRLVLADWLDEHGFTRRAEFIRRSIELESIPHTDPRFLPLFKAARAIEYAEARKWIRVEQPASCVLRTYYRRGFLGEVIGTMAQWVKSAGGLFRMAPIRTAEIDFYGSTKVPEFCRSPALARLARLTLIARTVSYIEARWLIGSEPLLAIPQVVIKTVNDYAPIRISAQAEDLLRSRLGDRLQMRTA